MGITNLENFLKVSTTGKQTHTGCLSNSTSRCIAGRDTYICSLVVFIEAFFEMAKNSKPCNSGMDK